MQHVPLVDADSLEPSIESATLMSSNRADEDASEAAQTTDHAAPDLTSLRLRVELSVLMLGCYGVMTILLSIPSLLIWNAAGLEVFEHPPSHKVGMLALNTGLDSIYNVLLLFGILVTTPLFMSVGVMLVMPFSIVVDRILHGTELGPSGVLGAIVIVIGFALLNVPPEASERCSLAMRRWLCSRKADTLYE